MSNLNINAPSHVKNAKLIAWVADMAALTKPDSIYWCDGSDEEYARLCQQLVDARHLQKTQPRQAPQQFPGLLRPQRRGPRGRPHLHLLREEGKRRPHQQLDGPRRHARAPCKPPCLTAA